MAASSNSRDSEVVDACKEASQQAWDSFKTLNNIQIDEIYHYDVSQERELQKIKPWKQS